MRRFTIAGVALRFRRSLPSLTALVALEAVIRHRSVTVAARELGVTQAAVSRQIASLEADFGAPLFVRRHRFIEPTGPCSALGATLASSLSSMAEGVEAVRSSLRQETVTIGATVAFSMLWLLPRLAGFRGLHPGAQIRVISQDSRLSLDGGEVDIVIRYGAPPFGDGVVLASRADTVVPVCSPGYGRRCSGSPLWDGSTDLIETEAPDRSWYRWRDWFARVGHAGPVVAPSLRFSHYTETISAARAGHGVALGWGLLLQDFLADGSLVRVGDEELVAEERHNILVPLRPRRSHLRDLAVEWMTRALQGDASPA